MGTWPIYKKTLPTTDLNKKKKLSFDKISPRDFYFFSFLFNLYLCNMGPVELIFHNLILVEYDDVIS